MTNPIHEKPKKWRKCWIEPSGGGHYKIGINIPWEH